MNPRHFPRKHTYSRPRLISENTSNSGERVTRNLITHYAQRCVLPTGAPPLIISREQVRGRYTSPRPALRMITAARASERHRFQFAKPFRNRDSVIPANSSCPTRNPCAYIGVYVHKRPFLLATSSSSSSSLLFCRWGGARQKLGDGTVDFRCRCYQWVIADCRRHRRLNLVMQIQMCVRRGPLYTFV